jgi:hypothetical protein
MGAPVILAILGIASNYCKMVFLFVPLPPVQTAFVSVTVTIGNGAYSVIRFHCLYSIIFLFICQPPCRKPPIFHFEKL